MPNANMVLNVIEIYEQIWETLPMKFCLKPLVKTMGILVDFSWAWAFWSMIRLFLAPENDIRTLLFFRKLHKDDLLQND